MVAKKSYNSLKFLLALTCCNAVWVRRKESLLSSSSGRERIFFHLSSVCCLTTSLTTKGVCFPFSVPKVSVYSQVSSIVTPMVISGCCRALIYRIDFIPPRCATACSKPWRATSRKKSNASRKFDFPEAFGPIRNIRLPQLAFTLAKFFQFSSLIWVMIIGGPQVSIDFQKNVCIHFESVALNVPPPFVYINTHRTTNSHFPLGTARRRPAGRRP